MQGTGTFMPLSGAACIGFGLANATQSAMDFEKNMSGVQAVAVIYKDSAEYSALLDKAKEMGATTEWMRSDAAQAEYYMAMTGWSTDKIIAALKPIMNMASAGGTDLATAADIMAAVVTSSNTNTACTRPKTQW